MPHTSPSTQKTPGGSCLLNFHALTTPPVPPKLLLCKASDPSSFSAKSLTMASLTSLLSCSFIFCIAWEIGGRLVGCAGAPPEADGAAVAGFITAIISAPLLGDLPVDPTCGSAQWQTRVDKAQTGSQAST
eukprot:3915368-Rhodomonas_salina.2